MLILAYVPSKNRTKVLKNPCKPKLTVYVLSPLPEIWDPKILETRFFVLEQLLFAMTIRTDDDITLLIDKTRNLETAI